MFVPIPQCVHLSTLWGLLVPLLGASKSTLLGVKGAVPPILIDGLTLAEE
jgi:hypothetical protein